MGLDNIPTTYACRKAGTAIERPSKHPEEEGATVIDCQATIDAGRCPWQTAMVGRGTPITSMMFGTPCWYRGKVGNWMLELLDESDRASQGLLGGFYGPDGTDRLSPEYCVALAKWMEDHAEAFAMAASQDENWQPVDESIEQYRYAAWWLRWVAETSDGSEAWW